VPQAEAGAVVIIRETEIEGVRVVEPMRHEDERGFFARMWDADEFRRARLADEVAQTSVSFNRRRGTLRGMHYQEAPHGEAKLVRCTAGAIFDVALDLRPESRTFRRWVGIELSAENRLALYIPEGCAHGFLTLADDSEVAYQMSTPHVPEAARGVRHDDPAFGIEWPGEVVVVNERDRSYPNFAVSEVMS
jgi:dTDP-4-dehydrorhamnose 3,5-epimerase